MNRRLILIILVNILFAVFTYGQVRIRIFAAQTPESALFSVTGGSYELRTFNGGSIIINRYEPVLITRFNDHLAVKTTHGQGFTCDSIMLLGKTGNDFFTLRINDGTPVRQSYSGDFLCFPDLGTLVMINNSNVERYIAGVVRAEGGSGRNKEYIKTQALLARTYMYKYFNKHTFDRYNVCDDIHCQAFNGLSTDSLINRAVRETSGQVILAHDSTLIISAFHSNCGGETSPPQDVWLTSQPYLKKVADPYCLSARNASWKKSIALKDWISFMQGSGYTGETDNPALFTFSQRTRQPNYRVGSFSVPLNTIRTELNLRSSFFSVIAEGDSIILKGRGYGHGVGLCQEGAMTMAAEGHTCKQIIGFYYSDVIITDIKNAVILDRQSLSTH